MKHLFSAMQIFLLPTTAFAFSDLPKHPNFQEGYYYCIGKHPEPQGVDRSDWVRKINDCLRSYLLTPEQTKHVDTEIPPVLAVEVEAGK